MRVLLFISLFLISQVHAQNREAPDLGSEFQTLMNELDYCIENSEENCHEILNSIIEKGKRENVAFLDNLYTRKAYYFWNRQALDSTIKSSQLALKHLNPVEILRADVEAYNLMANAYYFKGELKTAINYYLKVAEILEDGGNPLHLGYLYSNIATLVGETKNDDKQLEYLQKSYKLLDENNDERFIATITSNLGLAYYHLKDTTNALKWSVEALSLSELYNDLMAKTQTYLTLSLINKDLSESRQLAEQSVKYADTLGDITHQARAYYRFAEVLDQLGESKEALEYAEQAVRLSQEINDNVTLVQASFIAANINFNLGQKERASDYFQTYVIFKDSISSAENAREINEINTKYETQKKEKQIVEQELKIKTQQSNLLYAILSGALLISVLGGAIIYNKKTQQLRLKELRQEKENAILNSFILGEERERKRISHDLHDGVAAMIGAANMSLESIPHLPQEKRMQQLAKVQGILENSHRDIRHIAHNLLPTVLEKEGLIEATEQFVKEINETQLVNISVKDKNSKADQHSKQLQLMLLRVIQELVNNIIKHSQAQNAEIVFSEFENGIQIEITDDGIGYDSTANNGEQGLYSIAQRLKSIGGDFKISRGSQGGTQAKIELNE